MCWLCKRDLLPPGVFFLWIQNYLLRSSLSPTQDDLLRGGAKWPSWEKMRGKYWNLAIGSLQLLVNCFIQVFDFCFINQNLLLDKREGTHGDWERINREAEVKSQLTSTCGSSGRVRLEMENSNKNLEEWQLLRKQLHGQKRLPRALDA